MSDNEEETRCSTCTVSKPPTKFPVTVPSESVNFSRSHGDGFLASDLKTLSLTNSPLTYGELVILGYNDCSPLGETERRKNKFVLRKRPVPNGVKKSQHYVIHSSPRNSRAVSNNKQHSVAYSLFKDRTVIAEYMLDDELDMFQIGRSTESPIDFVVMDTEFRNKKQSEILLSRISRFACRILIQRSADFTASVYAAGFDLFRNIFLGEEAIKFQQNGDTDGLTTNGILIMHPRGPFCGGSEPGVWREVSVCGNIYTSREHWSSRQKGVKVDDATNVLQDGTLLDICGATLLWRSAEGLKNSPTRHLLEEKVKELYANRPKCPVRLTSLAAPWRSQITVSDKHPYVYLICGHVQSHHGWGQNNKSNFHTCPLCRRAGPIVKLTMGLEPSFYVDCEPPTFAFNPCGHMASEKTVKYWASVPIPTKDLCAACPFCSAKLCGDPGYAKLIFQDNIN